jgi:hypothetical protein
MFPEFPDIQYITILIISLRIIELLEDRYNREIQRREREIARLEENDEEKYETDVRSYANEQDFK